MNRMALIGNQHDREYDIVIIGGGVSGVNAAYRVQQGLPHLSYTILEARDVIGGTWSFFRYPGIRADSEISSFAFSWEPWNQNTTVADGPSIIRYVETTASKYGIDRKIQFNTLVTDVDWRSEIQRWRISTKANGVDSQTLYARFVIMSTGYYDYASPHQAVVPGIEKFKGQKIHPQFWPADLDYADKNVVIVGSGATAVTLVPAMSKTAKHVTMLQRTPSHFLIMPTVEAVDTFTRRVFPAKIAYAIIRLRILTIAFLFLNFCQFFPNAAAKLLRSAIKSELPPNQPMDPHFIATYPPFEQRLCITPDGDFFQALRDGKAHIETDVIETMDDKTIVLKSGKKIEHVDVLVTATGLKLRVIGGIRPSIDGVPVSISDKFVWRSTCLQDLPNLCFLLGYVDNSWTLGSDTSARLFVRLIRKLERAGNTSFVPVLSDQEKQGLTEVEMVKLSSGYIQRNKHLLPRAASTAPWKPRWHYFWDYWFAGYGNLDKGMKMVRVLT